MLNLDFSLTKVKNWLIQYKLAGLVLLLILAAGIGLIFSWTTTRPKKVEFTKSSGTPELAKEAKITFLTTPLSLNQPQTVKIERILNAPANDLAVNLAQKFGFDPAAAKRIDNLIMWSNTNESLEINLANYKIIWRKNPFTNRALLDQVGFGDEEPILEVARQFIKERFPNQTLLNLNAYEVEFVKNNGNYLTPTDKSQANTAVVKFPYQTPDQTKLITTGAAALVVKVQVSAQNTAIAFEGYLGNLTLTSQTKSVSFSGQQIVGKLESGASVVHAFDPNLLTEAEIPPFANLKTVMVDKIYPAYYLSDLTNFSQEGLLVAVAEGQATTLDNKQLRVWLLAAL